MQKYQTKSIKTGHTIDKRVDDKPLQRNASEGILGGEGRLTISIKVINIVSVIYRFFTGNRHTEFMYRYTRLVPF